MAVEILTPIFGGSLKMTGNSQVDDPPPSPVDVWDSLYSTWVESDDDPGPPTTSYAGTNESGASTVNVDCKTEYEYQDAAPILVSYYAQIWRGYLAFDPAAIDPSLTIAGAKLRVNDVDINPDNVIVVAWRGGVGATPVSLVPATDWLADLGSTQLQGQAAFKTLVEGAIDTDGIILIGIRSPSDVNNVKEYGTGSAADIAAYDLKIVAMAAVSLSFAGPNANRLMGAVIGQEFTLDGGASWITVTSADMDITPYIGSYNPLNGVQVREIGETDELNVTIIPAPLSVSWAWVGPFAYLLSGSTDDMEYSIDGSTWHTCSANQSLEDFLGDFTPDGNIVCRYIAFPDDSETFPMAPTEVTFAFDGENAMKLMQSDDTMEYSLDGGATYTPCETDTDLSEFLNTADWSNDILIRYIGAIVPFVFNLEDPPAPPDVSLEITF